MNHYHQALAIEAPPDTVYHALATPEGIRGWWTQDCEADTAVGGNIRLRFGATQKTLRIECLDPGHEVRWLCTEAYIAAAQLARQDEWVGTQMVFRLTPHGDGRARLDFEHVGLTPDLHCYDLCNHGWRYFLHSLSRFAETDRGTPYEPAAADQHCGQRACA